MKTLSLIITVLLLSYTSYAQDFIYEGPAKKEVRSFWMNATGIQKTGKITEGVAMMEAKLAEVKQKDAAYKTTDMEVELKKWKDKLGAASSNPVTPSGSSSALGIAAPQQIVNIASITISTPSPDYNGPAKMYVTNYYKQATDAKKFIEEQNFASAENKIEQMGKSLSQLKAKDASYSTGTMDTELKNFKAALETEKYNVAKGKQDVKSEGQKNTQADELLRQLFQATHIGFSTSDEPVMPLRVQEYKDKTQAYLAIGAKGSSNQLDYMKKLIEHHIVETNKEIVLIDNLVAKSSGTNWAAMAFYTIQYNLAFWDAAQKAYPNETDFSDEYKKTAAFATKIGSIENMKAKGGAAELVEIKNRKLPAPVVKDAKLEKILTDGFNAKYGTSQKATALKAVLTQDGWTTLRNSISGAVIGRERTAKVAYKGSDGKCYVLTDYVFIHEEYIGSSFTNTKAVFNWLDGREMLCENVK